VASKSGTTIEPNVLAAYFKDRLRAAGVANPGERFVAITDEGTALYEQALNEKYRDVFVNPSDIGGRYSALSFFGLVPEAIGQGAGRWMMNEALRLSWRDTINRVWLHTCTLDHPDALAFYLRSGFKPYARKLEMFPDPRLAGLLPRDAAPHVPIIEA
jgi:GNAT superfamily N-acetyltransferase